MAFFNHFKHRASGGKGVNPFLQGVFFLEVGALQGEEL